MSQDQKTESDPPEGPERHLLASDWRLVVDRFFAESGAASWGLTRKSFLVALERSISKRFAGPVTGPGELEEYLSALHLQDFALACACAEGHTQAWEHFVSTYRSYLRAAAAAILRCSANSPAARELADSLFADLYGVTGGKHAEPSLFRYFHGRSSLKTWLRAVLAQRHIDAIRASRRFTELQDDDAGGSQSRPAMDSSHAPSPPDPHRPRYLALFTRALEVALGLLEPRDHQRLRLYYVEDRTLAEIGRLLGEHESSVSRNLERIRLQLRHNVEEALRKGRISANGLSPEPGLSEEEISLCIEYASEDAPINLDKLFPPGSQQTPKTARHEP